MAAASEVMSIMLSIDTSELKCDLERIEDGELELPTVSAVQYCINGKDAEEIPIWLSLEA